MYSKIHKIESSFDRLSEMLTSLKVLSLKESELERINGAFIVINQLTRLENLNTNSGEQIYKNQIFLYRYLLEVGHRRIPYYRQEGVRVRVVDGIALLPEYDLDGDRPYVDYENTVVGGFPNTIFPDGNSGNTVKRMELYSDSFRGTRGYWIGGNIKIKETRTIQKLNYLSESLIPIGEQLDQLLTDQAYTGETSRCWIFGGWNGTPNTRINQIETLEYLTESAIILDFSLSAPRSMSTGSSTPFASYIFGGITQVKENAATDAPFSTHIDKFDHLSYTSKKLGAELNVFRSTENNAKGDRRSCWLVGGLSSRWLPSSTMEEFSFISESSILKGLIVEDNFFGFSSIGTASHIYFIGGGIQNNYYGGLNKISRFNLLDESFTPLGINLFNSRSRCASVNSSSTGYINGGYGSGNFSQGDMFFPTNVIEKLSSLDLGEYLAILGVQSSLQVNHAGISDYGENFSL